MYVFVSYDVTTVYVCLILQSLTAMIAAGEL